MNSDPTLLEHERDDPICHQRPAPLGETGGRHSRIVDIAPNEKSLVPIGMICSQPVNENETAPNQ